MATPRLSASSRPVKSEGSKQPSMLGYMVGTTLFMGVILLLLAALGNSGAKVSSKVVTPATAQARPSVLKSGVEYTLLSYTATTVEIEGKVVSTRLFTLGYADESTMPAGHGQGALKRFTLNVPVAALKEDKGLPENSLVMDAPLYIDGVSYQVVRYHAGYAVKADQRPAVVNQIP